MPFLFFLLALPAWADFQVPPLTGPVVDQAHMFSTGTAESLDRFIRQLKEQGGTQLQIATVTDLGGLAIEEASIKITDQWKLGSKKEERGVLLLFAPSEHKVRIEVGHGLEGDLPDVVANRIIREIIIPRMRQGSADRAVIDGVMAIVHYTDPKLAPDSGEAAPVHQRAVGGWLGFLLSHFAILIFIIIILVQILTPRRFRGGGWGGGGFYGGGFGGGGFGGGGGGGWSGGGGGFSGGGSSGSW